MLIRDNKYIPEVDKDFFILLRIGLWQEVAEGDELSPSPDWEYIYKLACEQTVQGIITDGIGLYRKHQQNHQKPSETSFIPLEWNDRFLSASAQVMRRNWTLNQKQAELCRLMATGSMEQSSSSKSSMSQGSVQNTSLNSSKNLEPRSIEPRSIEPFEPITYVVLKGQGIAQSYPKPMLRCSGDIDFLLPEADYERAKQLLDPEGKNKDYENHVDLHYSVEIDTVEVELHGMANTESGGKIDKVLDRERDRLFANRDFVYQKVSQGFTGFQEVSKEEALSSQLSALSYVVLPNHTYHALFLFYHSLRHFMGTGLGIRQLCDLAMFLHANRDHLDYAHIDTIINDTGVQKEWQLFLAFCTDWLGLKIPLSSQHSALSSGVLWEHAKYHGNFGHNHESLLQGDSNPIKHLWNLVKYNAIQFWRVAKINPRIAVDRLKRQWQFTK